MVTGQPRTFDRAEVAALERIVNVCDQGSWISGEIPDVPSAFDRRIDAEAKDRARRRQ